ncbi:MAG: ArsA family ATPase [Limisphaerales bacterium]
MRILLFSGKGGVGKTSLSAATGTRLAELGYRTVVMSVDPAHSLADAFDLDSGLFDARTADPFRIADNLWIHEVNIQKEIRRHWHRIWAYCGLWRCPRRCGGTWSTSFRSRVISPRCRFGACPFSGTRCWNCRRYYE